MRFGDILYIASIGAGGMILAAVSLTLADYWAERRCRAKHNVVACAKLPPTYHYQPVLE